MKKIQITIAVISIIIGVFLLDTFFGRWFSAWISTQSIVKKYGLVSPQTPLVINTKEEVRITDSSDLSSAVSRTQPHVAAVLLKSGTTVVQTGSAVSITEDGYFITTSASFPENGKEYWVQLFSGQLFAVSEIFKDQVTNMVVLKTDGHGLSVARFGQAQKLEAGDRLALMMATQTPQKIEYQLSYIRKSITDVIGLQFSASIPSNGLQLGNTEVTQGVRVASNKEGEIVGLGSNGFYYTGEQLTQLVQNFLRNNTKIVRPIFGFKYRYVTPLEEKSVSKVKGVEVTAIDEDGVSKQKSPAALVGLKVGDIIVEVDGSPVDYTHVLESVLLSTDQNSVLKLKVYRAGSTINMTLTPIVLP